MRGMAADMAWRHRSITDPAPVRRYAWLARFISWISLAPVPTRGLFFTAPRRGAGAPARDQEKPQHQTRDRATRGLLRGQSNPLGGSLTFRAAISVLSADRARGGGVSCASPP